jgi:hypothetical protein
MHANYLELFFKKFKAKSILKFYYYWFFKFLVI